MLNCWLQIEHRKVGNLLPIIPTILFIMFALISGVVYSQAISVINYRHSVLDNIWHILSAVIILAVLFILLIGGAGEDIFWQESYVYLCLQGNIYYLATHYENVDPNGTIRMFQLLAFPFLLALPANFPENNP